MATWIAENTQDSGGAQSLTFAIPVTAQAGDLLLVFVKQSENTTAGVWADDGGGQGYVRAAYDRFTPGRDQETAVYWKIHSGTETDPTFNWGGGVNEPMSGSMHVYRGVDQSNPIQDIQSAINQNDTTPPNAAVTTTAGHTVICFHAATHDDISAPAPPTGFTMRAQVWAGTADDHRNHFVADFTSTITGTYTPPDWQHTVLNNTPEYICYTLSLNEPAGVVAAVSGTSITLSGTGEILPSEMAAQVTSNTETLNCSWKTITAVTTNHRVQVQSGVTLYINSPYEMLVFTAASTQANQLQVQSGGTLAIGTRDVSAFGTNEQLLIPSTALVCSKNGPGCCSNGAVHIQAGGRLEMLGGSMEVNAVIDLDDAAEVFIRKGIMFSNNGDNNTRIRTNGGALFDIQGLLTFGCQYDRLSDQAYIAFSGIDLRNKGIPLEDATGTVGALRESFDVPDNRGTASAYGNNWTAQKDNRYYNCEAGTATVVVPDSTPGTPGPHLGAGIYQQTRVVARNLDGSLPQDAIFYAEDTDSGNRGNFTVPGVNYTPDQDYTNVLNTANSGTANFDILLGVWYRNDDTGDLQSPNGNELLDSRCKTDVPGEDLKDLHVRSLRGLPVTFTDQTCHQLLRQTHTFTLLPDAAYNGDDLATVLAYTTTDLTQLYARAKAWNIDPANVNFPNPSDSLISANGDLLDIGDYSFELGSAFGVNTSTQVITFNPADPLITDEFLGFSSTGTTFVVQSQADADAIAGLTLSQIAVDGPTTINLDAVNADVLNIGTGPLTVNPLNGSQLTTTEPGTGNGQVFIAPPIVNFSLTGLSLGTRVILIDRNGASPLEIDNQLESGGQYNYSYNYTSDLVLWVSIVALDDQIRGFEVTLSGENQSFPASQQLDRVYINPV